MRAPGVKARLYQTDTGHNANMRTKLATAVRAVHDAQKYLDKIQNDGTKLAAVRRFNEGLDQIRMYYVSGDNK